MAGDKYWDKYFPTMRDQLLKMQNDNDGSWEGDGIGQTYGTAIALISCNYHTSFCPFTSGDDLITAEAQGQETAVNSATPNTFQAVNELPPWRFTNRRDRLSLTTNCGRPRRPGPAGASSHDGLREQMAARGRRPGRSDRAADDRHLRPRPLHARRRARAGEDADGQHAGRMPVAQLQPHSVHARPDAQRHHRHRSAAGRPRNAATRHLRFVHGPIFTNILLADEINRTPPKTQAALLEAMQERQVSAGGKRHGLPDPFFVLATQNPIEQEGTYPLPEAQLDRFMFKVYVGYPTPDEERQIYRLHDRQRDRSRLRKVLDGRGNSAFARDGAQRAGIRSLLDYAMALVRATRAGEAEAPRYIRKWVSWGAGPRAGQALILGRESPGRAATAARR